MTAGVLFIFWQQRTSVLNEDRDLRGCPARGRWGVGDRRVRESNFEAKFLQNQISTLLTDQEGGRVRVRAEVVLEQGDM